MTAKVKVRPPTEPWRWLYSGNFPAIWKLHYPIMQMASETVVGGSDRKVSDKYEWAFRPLHIFIEERSGIMSTLPQIPFGNDTR